MKIPSSPTALVTLTAFIHFTTAMAWMPVDTLSQKPIPSPSAIPLYRDYGSSSEVYYIYFNPDNRELLWRIVNHEGGEEVYSQIVPDYVKTVSASTFKDSRVYIAGMATDERWFISALNHFGEIIWQRWGKENDSAGVPLGIEVYKLVISEDGIELYALGKAYNSIIQFSVSALNGKNLGVSSQIKPKRKLLHDNSTEHIDGDLFPDPEEHARVVIIEWIGGVIGVIGGLSLIGATAGLAWTLYKKCKREISDFDNVENQRRNTERKFIDESKRLKPYQMYIPSPDLDSGSLTTAPVALLDTKLGALIRDPEVSGSRLNQLLNIQKSLVIEKDVESLFNAIKSGNMEQLKKLINDNPSLINSIDEEGNTPLHYTASLGLIFIAPYLIENGARPDLPSNAGYTPLQLAAMRGNLFLFQLFLDSTIDIDYNNRSKLFHLIANSRNAEHSVEMYKLMKQHGLDESLEFEKFGRFDWLKRDLHLIKVKHYSLSKNGLTILHEAAISGNADLIIYIISNHMVSVNAQDEYGNTPLHYAAAHDISDGSVCISALSDKGANLNAQNHNEQTPMHLAVLSRNHKAASFLKKKKNIELGIRSKGNTPLELASARLYNSKMITILRGDSEDDFEDALIVSVITGNIENAKTLLKESPFINLNTQDADGNTALHLATLNNHPDLIVLLIVKGADTNIKNNNGHIPLEIAKVSKLDDVVKIFERAEQGIKDSATLRFGVIDLSNIDPSEEL